MTHRYAALQSATDQTTVFGCRAIKIQQNHIKARKEEMEGCGKVGNSSTTNEGGTCQGSPRSTNRNWLELVCSCVALICRRAHWCTNMAIRAQIMLIVHPKNQSGFTQTACLAQRT